MKYHFIEVKTNSKLKAPYFTGSMLRGAFGYALKKVVCINPSYRCEGCFAKENCLYYDFYEKPNTFHPFRFDIKLESPNYNFGLYLFNQATDKLPYILSALHKMLTEIGISRENHTFHNIEISVNNTVIYRNNEFKLKNLTPKEFHLDNYCRKVKIQLLTPLRIKKNNKLLRENLEVEDILRSIYQREQELNSGKRVHSLNYTPKVGTTLKLLQYKHLKRKSNRQKQILNIDGLIGEMVATDIDQESYRLLKVGEIIGVGKQTVMGLGKIEIEDSTNKDLTTATI